MENGAYTPDESITNGTGRVDGADGKVENGGNAPTLPDEVEERKLGVLCGAAGIYPKWLQGMARPRYFLLVYCIQQITLGACNAYFVGANSSLERHFNYTSTDIGVITLLSEIGPFFFTLILSYWGSMGNRPRWMGIGPIISSFGIFLIFLIYIFFPAPALSESGLVDDVKSKKFCQPKEEISFSPLEPGSSNNSVLYSIPAQLEEEFDDICFAPNAGAGFLWVVAHTLIGMGTAVTYTVGASYLDDNISKNDAPIYFGVTLAVRILGPMIGFTMAGSILRIYVNPSQSYGITPKDPRWIGAWWIGPLIFSTIMIINSFILLLFPEKMERGSGSRINSNNKPDKLSIMFSKVSVAPTSTKETDNQSHENGTTKNSVNGMNGNATNQQNGYKSDKPKSIEENEKSFGMKKIKEDVKGLTQMLMKLLRNKPLMCLVISDFFAFLGLIGLIFWLPKYLEHQFRISKSSAAISAGISSTSSIILGVVGGCVWIRRFHPTAKTVAIVMATCSMAYAVSLFGLMFVTCDFNDDQPGILSPDKTSLELYRGCSSSACECGKAEFIPVCVIDKIAPEVTNELTYFSPCHAGCPDTNQPSNSTEYFNCTCAGADSKVTTGYCESTCSGFVFYNVLTLVVKAFVAIGGIGGLLITMRCVAPEEKPVALGLKITLISLVLMVNPLIFARLTDSACLVWAEACGEQGSCWIYDADDLGYKLHGTAAFLFFISGLFEILLAMTVGDLQLMEEPKKILRASPSTTTTGGRSYISSLRKFSQRTLTSTASVNTTSSSANNSIRSLDTKEGLKIEETIPETDDALTVNNDEDTPDISVNEQDINDKNVLPSDIVKTTGV